MQTLKNYLKFFGLLLICVGGWLAAPAGAATDFEAQQSFASARAKMRQPEADHTAHQNHTDQSQVFHGIFYGFLPCNDCTGVKTTLSLKQNNNYLLVTQYARESSREYYEKGKYNWNTQKQMVVLTPSKGGANPHYYRIENDEQLVQLNQDGTKIAQDADRYILQRSDTVKSREVHIH